jgi:hypothetical protein
MPRADWGYPNYRRETKGRAFGAAFFVNWGWLCPPQAWRELESKLQILQTYADDRPGTYFDAARLEERI